ncbi:RidA family protein [uncultured Oxalicibacterium sp.]|uniref:RidA family protein n=1 Tax=uncultured Oxalicibacterium sp. TaxID=1168540 RepID=UPI0025D1F80E|nr:RidA family protein [uncultured Oxalicibacterium sp.]
MNIARMHVGDTLSEIAIHNGTVYLAGQIAEDTSQDIRGQTHEVLGHIDRLLADAGSDKSRILSCQIFIADVADFEGMNEVWNAWVVPGHTPPRATVGARFPDPGRLIEIIIVAATNQVL